MHKRVQTFKFIFFDWLAAGLAWTLFYVYRKIVIETTKFGVPDWHFDNKFIYGVIIIPVCWVVFYALIGTYKNVYRKSRLAEVSQTLLTSLIGVLIIFFTLLLDDTVISYKTYYHTFLTLFTLQFLFTVISRLILSTNVIHKLRRGDIGFNTIIIGSNKKAVALLNGTPIPQNGKQVDIQAPVWGVKGLEGNKIVGFVHVEGNNDHLLIGRMPHLGNIYNLQDIIATKKVDEAIIAIESSEHDKIGQILNELEDTRVLVKIIPDMYDILSGSVKMNSIYGAPLIAISPELMPIWQQSVKRLIDVVVSFFVLILFSPLYLFTAIGVKLSSTGRLFYRQERIGLHGQPFHIYKFRSMYENAEKDGPRLSSTHDNRLTPFGRWMRKIRLDEIPQFWNVLIGDMSIVGPRPERQYFIDQIMPQASHYRHLHKVRPGITSWGQVKFGYAENVDQMIERLKYDLIYIENMSLALDFKIMIYTFLIILQRRGK